VPIDYDAARDILTTEFEAAEALFREGREAVVPKTVALATEGVFRTKTQAYREALLGCAIVRIQDPDINIRLPYVNQGEDAFNGRTLDERVINPFLHDHRIPASRGPYLSALRRNVRFVPETLGQRDAKGYASFLEFISELEVADSDTAREYLRHLLWAFVKLRDSADIPLSDVHRLSVEQYGALIDGLLTVRSGGLLPVLLAVATFKMISQCFGLNWRIEWQGINVADRAHGAGGDISVFRNGELVFSVEVTEREIDRARVVATFNGKIAPNGIDDYLFFFTATNPTDEARQAARQYFAQGHEINFVPIRDWIISVMTTSGPRCRRIFTEQLRELLSRPEVPAALKVAWNDHLQAVLAV